jgi:hypothetical protein
MGYTFKMPEKPFVNELILFYVDTNGEVILEGIVSGIPNLTNYLKEAIFQIDKPQAKQIAKDAGLEDGIAGWNISFHWFAGDFKTYVWTVQNLSQEQNAGTQSYSAYGREIVIDVNSGEILLVSEWGVVT